MRYIDQRLVRDADTNNVIAELDDATREVRAQPDADAARSEVDRRDNLWTKLRPALEKASYDKCWYTECKSDGALFDVDHFRPKKAVSGEPGHHGYYWLAFDWMNFRLCAQISNRLNRNPNLDEVGGKGNEFPLLSGSTRSQKSNDDIKLESPALLDPTCPTDPLLISFGVDGRVALSPKYVGDPIAQERFEKSQKIYHLNWPRFEEGRRRLWNEISGVVDEVERARLLHRSQNGAETYITNLKEIEEEAIKNLLRLMKGASEYSAAARAYVRTYRDVPWVALALEIHDDL